MSRLISKRESILSRLIKKVIKHTNTEHIILEFLVPKHHDLVFKVKKNSN